MEAMRTMKLRVRPVWDAVQNLVAVSVKIQTSSLWSSGRVLRTKHLTPNVVLYCRLETLCRVVS